MSYPRRRLHEGENVVLDVHPHPFFFFGPVVWLSGAIIAAFVSVLVLSGKAERAGNNLVIGAIVIGLVWLVGRYVRWRNTMFVVTNQRLISQTGVFTRKGIEIPIERVNNVGFRQSILERFMGVGDIEIESGGEDGKQEIPDIRDPNAVKLVIISQIQDGRRGPSTSAAGATAATAPTGGTANPGFDYTLQLERLEAMLDRGTLTWDEFQTQKRRLLSLPDVDQQD